MNDAFAASSDKRSGAVRKAPKEITIKAKNQPSPHSSGIPSRPKIWIDLENTPHVPFFEPIIDELVRRRWPVLLTARDAFQVCELADRKGFNYRKIGRHYGKNRLHKLLGLFYRAAQLAPTVRQERPIVGISHGSRSQIITCNLLRISSLAIGDYEYTRKLLLMSPSWLMVPEVIPDEVLHIPRERILRYPGIKEDVYLHKLKPDPTILSRLGLQPDNIVVTVRPPATEAHYHNPEAETLLTRFMERVCNTPRVQVVLLPRNRRQAEVLRNQSPHWFNNAKTIIPDHALDGLNLVWHSDLVVSGGGTMNREAAALGVMVYSIFRGKTGAVDRYLEQEGRLVMIRRPEEVDQKIILTRRERKRAAGLAPRPAFSKVIAHIEDAIKACSS